MLGVATVQGNFVKESLVRIQFRYSRVSKDRDMPARMDPADLAQHRNRHHGIPDPVGRTYKQSPHPELFLEQLQPPNADPCRASLVQPSPGHI